MRQQGFMLIELIISMVVLTIGLGGLLILMISAMYTDKRSGSDTASVMIAEHVLEQISAEPASSITPLQITDCTGAVLTINTAGALLNGRVMAVSVARVPMPVLANPATTPAHTHVR